MFQKIKDQLNATAVVIMALLVGLWYLLTQNRALKDKLASAEFDKKDGELKNEQDNADHSAANARDKYVAARDAAIRGLPPTTEGSDQGGG